MRHESIQLELFSNRFRQVALEMGELLRRTAASVNIKERLDFSCALLDEAGWLVVNAPHIPVHLGALGLCVRSVSSEVEWHPGDVVLTNHPGFGGSHLPDVTVITPVFESSRALLGFVANRAHHAEIGGVRPGSMPPEARSLAEEGVVVPPMFLAREGTFDWERVRQLLAGGPYPSRTIDENLADLAAAVAANRAGELALLAQAGQFGADTLRRYMTELAQQAASGVRRAWARLGHGVYSAEECLDDGSPIRVAVTVPRPSEKAVIDFEGSAEVHPGNLNAVPAIVRSAVLYVLRLLVNEPVPFNEGLLADVDLRIPPGLLNPFFPEDPADCPAVVGGNVETSQRIVDTLLKALGVVAASQGTMNNVLFGNDRFAYYETIGGGAGAGATFDGASGVHCHMTNTAITDPEILEHRYPVRLERFAIRRGSGGSGKYRGGDGLVREIRFLEPLTVSVLTQRRREGPYGLAGGESGEPGRQCIVHAMTGEKSELGSVDGREVAAGDLLVIETPGGGGYGSTS